MVNEYEFRIFGMMRSGNHCIINWIAGHFDEVYYFNDVLCYRNPLELHNNNVFDVPQYVKVTSDNIYDNKECLIYSYEDIDPVLVHGDLVPNKVNVVGTSNNEYSIMILRDPFNLIASRFKSGLYSDNDIRLWKNYARESISSEILGLSFTILYDNWVISREYRDKISVLFNKINDDKAINQVAWCGSSFVGGDVLDRWDDKSNYDKDYEWWSSIRKRVLEDNELMNLRERIFGNIII